MNGLVSKYFVLMILFLLGIIQGVSGETIQMGFHLPTYPQADRDFFLIQNFLLSQAFSEVDRNSKETCKFVLSDQGKLVIEGEQERIHSFAGALGKAIEKVIGEEINEETLKIRKEKYLASSEDLMGNALIKEIQQENLFEVRKSLQPLAKMLLCAASSVASEDLPLTLVSDASQYHHFYSLPISEIDQNNIYELIKKMAEYGYWDLLRRKKEMEKLGDSVNHVHPLRFIGYIYTHPELKKLIIKILNDVLGQKKKGFLNGHGKKKGFAHRMTKEMHHDNLMHYVPGFAQAVGVDEGQISYFFYHHDWEGLLFYLNKKC